MQSNKRIHLREAILTITLSMLSAHSFAALELAKPFSKQVNHRIKKGDTLYRLAKQYGTTVKNIKLANSLQTNLIRVGENILIDQQSSIQSFDESGARVLAKEALRYGEKNAKKGNCLRGFRIAFNEYLRKVRPVAKKLPYLGTGPADFINKAKTHPSFLRKIGLVRQFPKHLAQLQIGSVLVYKPGTCGFSKKHGHIEVLIDADSRRVCSDHCSNRSTSCQPDYVFMPINS